jgi:hypothetical protein
VSLHQHYSSYTPRRHLATAVSPPRELNGRNLAGLNKSQTALAVVDVLEKKATVTPTIARIAAALGVSPRSVNEVRAFSPLEREQIRWGMETIQSIKAAKAPKLSPRERLHQIVREIGVDATFDLLTSTE